MNTKFELFANDNKSDASAPPSYDAVSTSSLSADSVQCRPPPVFSQIRIKQTRATVLSLIRDMVSTPDFTPASITPIVNACAAALPAAEFTDVLQTPNIEGHTAMYWAIVNNRPQVLWALFKFIPRYTSAAASDVRLACMTTSDHALFMKLNLKGNSNCKDEPLNRSLGCPPDEIQVHEGDGLPENQFTANFRIRMFQKRLRIAQNMRIELIAKGRIWYLLFYTGDEAKLRVRLGLSWHSLPARPNAALFIKAQKEQPDCVTPPEGLLIKFQLEETMLLSPEGNTSNSHRTCTSIDASLGNWLMYDNTMYVDSDGTLHARLEMELT
ncbi:uncharacterized protein EDB91DRAFT_23151 [Suillus paluster]|uniref:uncharacterized protein n=1 Tax=Suillus paluster TaxID=48578 RepID=UPI001B8716C2|nr:uncharacterized protein EDB91DRAFT_23151 [Suillus paluster]KAG1756551.1 hypothetical protein EDB91DRAFT_23151 [Suillus paluster]